VGKVGNQNSPRLKEIVGTPKDFMDTSQAAESPTIVRARLETSTMKTVTDILSLVDRDINIILEPNQMTLLSVAQLANVNAKIPKKMAKSAAQLSQCECIFKKDEIPIYDYQLADERYILVGNGKEFKEKVRGIKDSTVEFVISIIYRPDGFDIILDFVTGTGGQWSITLYPINFQYTNQYNYWYTGATPIATPMATDLSMMLENYRRSTAVKVHLFWNLLNQRVELCGYKAAGTVIGVDPIRDGIQASRASTRQDLIIRSIDTSVNSWFFRVAKLTDKGIVQFYLRDSPDAPIVVRTFIGSQGIAIFSIPNIDDESGGQMLSG
jgi:hypothetical protein